VLKQSRLHGDVNEDVLNLFSLRVSEVRTLKRLCSSIKKEIKQQKTKLDAQKKEDTVKIESL